VFSIVQDWIAGRARRAEALRRLGGPDVLEEERKKRMDGDQKLWAIGIVTVAMSLGGLVFAIFSYHVRLAALEASTRPSTDAVLFCVDSCARSCVDHAESEAETSVP